MIHARSLAFAPHRRDIAVGHSGPVDQCRQLLTHYRTIGLLGSRLSLDNPKRPRDANGPTHKPVALESLDPAAYRLL